MAQTYHPGVIRSIEANTAITQSRAIDANGNHCAAGERAVGVSLYDTDAGKMASIIISGDAIMECGAAVAAGDRVMSDAQGRAIPVVALADPLARQTSSFGIANNAGAGVGKFISVTVTL